MSFVICIVGIIGLIICIFYRIKVENTGKMFFKVIDAISDYNCFQIRNNCTPDMYDEEEANYLDAHIKKEA